MKPITRMPAFNLPEDGESTRQLKQKVNGSEIAEVIEIDDRDSIEEYSDGPSRLPTRSSPSAPPGTVEQLRQVFEINKPASQSPYLDLKLARVTHPITHRMKGKPAKVRNRDSISLLTCIVIYPMPLQLQNLDPEATTSAGYTTSPKPTAKSSLQKSRRYSLPIKSHTFGVTRHDAGDQGTSGWLCFEGPHVVIRETSEPDSREYCDSFRPEKFIGEMQVQLCLHFFAP